MFIISFNKDVFNEKYIKFVETTLFILYNKNINIIKKVATLR
jgi:hypothetical protein